MKRSAGFSLIEALIVIAIGITMAAIAIPQALNAMKNYRLQAATAGVSGAIQAARFQAIMHGCAYQLAISSSALTYQTYSEVPSSGSTCLTSFNATTSAIPIVRQGDATIDHDVTMTFKSNGTMAVASGSLPITISNGISSKSLNVSGVGDVTVTP